MRGWTPTASKPWGRLVVTRLGMPAEQRGSAYRTAKGWGIRWYELDGRRACRAGFATKTEARHYFEEQVRPRLWGRAPDMTLAELVDAYLDAHSVGREPRTIRTLRERLKYATDRFGDVKLTELERNPRLIATWMRTLPAGSRYGIVQALRQTLETAIRWRMISENPAKLAGRNPEPRREHVAPFEHSEVDRLAVELGPYGPLVIFAAETGLRPSEWMALERRDVDRRGAAVSVERTYADGRVKTYGKTMATRRRVPLSSRAQSALDRIPARVDTPAALPLPDRRVHRPVELPRAGMAPRPGGRRHPTPPHLRPAPHLHQPRVGRRDIHLRTRALHGHLGADDRPHLRAPRAGVREGGPRQARPIRRKRLGHYWATSRDRGIDL